MREAFSAVSPLQTAAYAGPYTPPPVEDVAGFFPHLEILGLVFDPFRRVLHPMRALMV